MASTSYNIIHSHNLKILIYNACGLARQKILFANFLHTHRVDVALISETHFTSRHNFNIANYTVYRTDCPRGTATGGSAVIIRSTIPHFTSPLPHAPSFEATAVTIGTSRADFLKLVAVYKRPQQPLAWTDLDRIFVDDVPTLVGGDFNAKSPTWNSSTTNTCGRVLSAYAEQYDEILVVGPHKHPLESVNRDIIDIAVFRDVHATYNIYQTTKLSSDHLPVFLELSGIITPRYSITKKIISWDAYHNTLKHKNFSYPYPHTHTEIDSAVSTFTADLQEALNSASETHQRREVNYYALPRHINDLIRAKNRYLKRWHRFGLPSDKREANSLKRQISREISHFRNQQWNSKIMSLNRTDNSIWDMVRTLKHARKTDPPALRNTGGQWAYTPLEKCEFFAEHLERNFAPTVPRGQNDISWHTRVTSDVDKTLATPLEQDECPTFHWTEVKSHILDMKSRKAPGIDNITSDALKHLPSNYIGALTNIVNDCWRLSYFPSAWKRAVITNIPKPGKDVHCPSSYRPISLLPMPAKVLEKTLLTHFTRFMEMTNNPPPYQFGFRSRHSCNLQLLRKVETIVSAWDKKLYVAVLYLDIKAAFDTVWHAGLIWKLFQAGCPLPLLKLVCSYLNDRTFCVKISNKQSASRGIHAGVPQGGVLSPQAFNFYMSDLPDVSPCALFQYADDTAIMSISMNKDMAVRKLQKATKLLETWFSKWALQLNTDKCAAMLYTPHHTHPPKRRIQLNGRQIDWVTQYKYLGLTFDRQLSWRFHVQIVRQRSKVLLTCLYGLLKRNSVLSVDNKLLIYKTVILPIITFGFPALTTIKKTHLNTLSSIQNKFLRLISNAPMFTTNRAIHFQLSISSIPRHIQELLTSELERLDSHPNDLLTDCIRYDLRPLFRLPHPRHFLLRNFDF